MEVKAKQDLERHLTANKFYRVVGETDKEYEVINDSKVKYSYPKKAFEVTAESQTRIVNPSKNHTTVNWTDNGASITSNNSGAYFNPMPSPKIKNPFPTGHPLHAECKRIDQEYETKRRLESLERQVIIPSRPENNVEDDSINNGGSTDYYKINPEWKDLQDIIEERKMIYSQANILKVAFTFNVGRHEGTDELREINKIIYFAERRKQEILKERNKQ